MTPVRPPNRKVVRNPIAHIMGVSKLSDPPHMVPIQLKNFTPVGTAIMKVMNEKNGRIDRAGDEHVVGPHRDRQGRRSVERGGRPARCSRTPACG